MLPVAKTIANWRSLTVIEKVEVLLETEGFKVKSVRPVKGYWKSQDVVRWDWSGWVEIEETGGKLNVRGYCWWTMTECVRKGIIVKETSLPCVYEIVPAYSSQETQETSDVF